MLHFGALNKCNSGTDNEHRNNETPDADCPGQQRIETATNRTSDIRVDRHKEQDSKTDQSNAAKFVTASFKNRLQNRRTTDTPKLHFLLVNWLMATQRPDLGVAA
jgi:hypothetical protein